MDKFKNLFGSENASEEQGFVDELWKNSSLSWSTRIQFFIAFFALGLVCSILSSVAWWLGGGIIAFAVLYTLGNILSLCSTCFLMGPCSQLKKMFAETRIFATILMLVFFTLTLMSAFWWENKGLTLLFVILQFLAMIWYSLSYIPFARDAVKKLAGTVLDV